MNPLIDQQYMSFSIGGLPRHSGAFSGQYKAQDAKLGTAGVFAADIVSRISRPASSGTGSGLSAAPSAGEAAYQDLGRSAPKANADLDGLRTSLENTINAVASRHGSQAATAVMGIVYQNVGFDVTEENLGQGFLKAISFIDRNFGIVEGNRLMGDLNESLNDEMNAVFDNGQNEVFFDNTSPNAALRTAKGLMQTTNGMFEKALEGDGEGEGTDLNLAGPMSGEELREQALRAQAKRMLANGELPPAYLQEYLPDGAMSGAATSGGLLNTEV